MNLKYNIKPYNNTTEYVSLSWLEEKDRDPQNYEMGSSEMRINCNNSIQESVNTIWHTLQYGSNREMLLNERYVQLYRSHRQAACNKIDYI